MSTSTVAEPEAARLPRRRRAKVPTTLQLEQTECGAASLAMVLGHYGKFVPLDELRIACGVSRDGSNAKNLVQAARKYGLTTTAYRREPEDLKALTFPLIVHWRFFHFVVVEGWSPQGWYLNDPANGPRLCSEEEFDRSFTGIVVEAVPGPDFERGGSRPGIVRRLFRVAGSTRAAMILAAVLALLLVIPTVLVPQVVTLYGAHLQDSGGLLPSQAVAGLALAVVIQFTLLLVQGSLSLRLATKVTVLLSSSLVNQLLRLPAAFHAQRGASVLGQRAQLANSLSAGVSTLTITVAASLLTGIIGAIVLLVVDWVAGLVAVLVSVAVALVVRRTLSVSRDNAAKLIVDSISAGASVSSALNQIESVKASGSEDGVIAQSLGLQYKLLATQQEVGVQSVSLRIIPSLTSATGTLLISAVAAWRVMDGSISPGAFLAILALSAIVIGPISQVVVAMEQVQTLRPTLDQVDDVLDSDIAMDPTAPSEVSQDVMVAELLDEMPMDAISKSTGPGPEVIRGELELRDIVFGYSPISDPSIKGFSASIKPGHRVALVGPSGCGKSTLSRLVTGLYTPWSGEILIDGRPRGEHNPRVLCEYLALVDQDVTVFAGSIRDNVTLWDSSIPQVDVVNAIRDAGLEDDVARRPGGLDAELKEGGIDLSGGQRQRLEIARALVRNPSILVMDEATSALDPITEQRIDEALRRRGITCLVIAHRLSTIRDSDEIIVLNKGTVVERGTHEELLALGGMYSTLIGTA